VNIEILINLSLTETRVAVVESGILQELYLERSDKCSVVGNIYQGKVARVLPGMQAAFVDIGLERTAFLHSSELHNIGNKPINQMLQEGQKIIVQVIKDPIDDKGARLTTFLTLSSRNLVYLPNGSGVKLSSRIDDAKQRDILTAWVKQFMLDQEKSKKNRLSGGFIVRTVAENASYEAIMFDINYLLKLWEQIKQFWNCGAGALIYQDLSLLLKVLRDFTSSKVDSIKIDARDGYYKARNFAQELIPEIHHKIEHYNGEYPIFDLYGVEDELERALQRKVNLKSGGYIVIDQTEAMTTIDVNTGAFVGGFNLEETIFKTNLEAVATIARQLRLRNIGGIIIVDFIDMYNQNHKNQVMQMLEKHLSRDVVKIKIMPMSEIGTVQITRKRQSKSLEQILCKVCESCDGRGKLLTEVSISYAIFREITRIVKVYGANKVCVLASSKIIDYLLDEQASSIAQLESNLAISIRLHKQNDYNQEQYDVVIE